MNTSYDYLLTVYSKGENYAANIVRDNTRVLNGKPSLFWFGDADNDVDGTPYWDQDKTGARDTRLHFDGKPINGDIIPGIVVPPEVIACVPDIVMGCIGTIEYKGTVVACVVFDSGPHSKIGELSPAALRAIGAPALHNGNGGIDEQSVLYRIWPGVAATLKIGEETYSFALQKS